MELVARARDRRARRLRASGCCCGRAPSRWSSGCRCSPTPSTSSSSPWAGCGSARPPIVEQGRRGRSGGLRRPAAAGAGADRDRHQLRHDGAFPRRAARLARPDRHRPCRRQGAGRVSRAAAPDDRADPAAARRRGADAASTSDRRGEARHQPRRRPALLPSIAWSLLDRAEAPWAGPRSALYLLGDWPPPFGIVLVLDRLSALMLLLTAVLALAGAGLRLGALGPAGAAFPQPVPVPADGAERRLPDRRPVQPVRLLRGAAGRLLRADAARLGAAPGAGRACTTSRSTSPPRCCS